MNKMPHARQAIAFRPGAITQPSMASTETASHAGHEMGGVSVERA